MEKLRRRDSKKAARVTETAKIVGVSARHVRRVLNGEYENENVMNVFMELAEGENLLLEAVKKSVPLN